MYKGNQTVVAILLVLMFQQTWTLSTAEPIPVTVKQLLTTPEQFDRKHVSVIGYYVDSFERTNLLSCLFVDAFGAKGSYRDSIWVDQTTFIDPGTPTNPAPPLIGISDVGELENHYVRLVGIFRFAGDRGFGPGGFWPSEITGIVNLRIARKTP
jgi:hypothetical protein